MKKYKVGVVLEQGGFVVIEANSAEEASVIVNDKMSETDFDELDVEITHRDFWTIDEEEVIE